MPLGYRSVKKEEDGLHLWSISTFRMNGKVPKKFNNWATKKGTKMPLYMEEYIMDGKVPKIF